MPIFFLFIYTVTLNYNVTTFHSSSERVARVGSVEEQAAEDEPSNPRFL